MQQHTNQIVYHAVSEQPMHMGQIITMDSSNPNGVHRRVQCIQHLRSNPPRETDTLTELEQAAMKDFHRWSMVADRELALEQIRQTSYPHYPSRMACLYAALCPEEAIQWADMFRDYYGRTVYSVVEMKVHGSIFTGYADNCWTRDLPEAEHLSNAQHYWANKTPLRDEPHTTETLISGRIEVMSIIKDYTKDQ